MLSVAAPVYSAKIVDLLFKEFKAAIETGDIFRVSWEHVGREIMILLLIYTVTGILYMFQSFLMASFAERLSLELRTKISRKLSRLPLSYYDGHQPGEVLSRATNDLDKMAEVMQTGLLKLFTVFFRRDTLCSRFLFDFQTVFISSGEEDHIIALHSSVPCDRIAGNCCIAVPDMGISRRIVNRCRDIIRLF